MTQEAHTLKSFPWPAHTGALPPLAMPPWDRALVGAARAYTTCVNGAHRQPCPLAPPDVPPRVDRPGGIPVPDLVQEWVAAGNRLWRAATLPTRIVLGVWG